MLQINLLILLSLLLSGCHYQASTKVSATNLITPYGKADNINAERNSNIEVR